MPIRPALAGLAVLATCLTASRAHASDGADRAEDENIESYPAPRKRSVGLGMSLAPVAAQEIASKITTEPSGQPTYDYFVGGRASASLYFSVGHASEIVAGVFVAPTTSSTAPGTLMPIGGRIEARYDIVRPVFTGLALSAGYLIAPNEEPVAQFVYEPVSSMFYAPELIPIGVRLGEDEELELGLGISVLFSQQNDTLGALFSSSYFTQTLWAGYVLPL